MNDNKIYQRIYGFVSPVGAKNANSQGTSIVFEDKYYGKMSINNCSKTSIVAIKQEQPSGGPTDLSNFQSINKTPLRQSNFLNQEQPNNLGSVFENTPPSYDSSRIASDPGLSTSDEKPSHLRNGFAFSCIPNETGLLIPSARRDAAPLLQNTPSSLNSTSIYESPDKTDIYLTPKRRPASLVKQEKAASCDNKRGRPRADHITHLIFEGAHSPSGIKCKVCNRVFPREKSLQAHLRTHTGERPYECDYPGCGRAFTQSGQLKTHQRLHAGEKPFQCSFEGCQNRYTHANRTCPEHPYNKPHRSSDLVLQPIISNSLDYNSVMQWLEKYKNERMDKTPGKACADEDNVISVTVKHQKIKRGLVSQLEQENSERADESLVERRPPKMSRLFPDDAENVFRETTNACETSPPRGRPAHFECRGPVDGRVPIDASGEGLPVVERRFAASTPTETSGFLRKRSFLGTLERSPSSRGRSISGIPHSPDFDGGGRPLRRTLADINVNVCPEPVDYSSTSTFNSRSPFNSSAIKPKKRWLNEAYQDKGLWDEGIRPLDDL